MLRSGVTASEVRPAKSTFCVTSRRYTSIARKSTRSCSRNVIELSDISTFRIFVFLWNWYFKKSAKIELSYLSWKFFLNFRVKAPKFLFKCFILKNVNLHIVEIFKSLLRAFKSYNYTFELEIFKWKINKNSTFKFW